MNKPRKANTQTRTMQCILRAALIVAVATCSPTPALAAQEPASTKERLTDLLEANSYTLSLDEGQIDGEGAEWLSERAREARFTLFGESHLTRDIAQLATGLWRTIAPAGYRHAVIETSPLAARTIEDLLDANDPNAFGDYLADGNRQTIPFYSMREEVAFARAVVESSDAAGPALWGVDQIFVRGGTRVLEHLRELATTGQQRATVERLLAKARSKPELVATASKQALEALADAFAEGPAAATDLVHQLRQSHRIYRPFTQGKGSVYRANRRRERLMKNHFIERYRAAEKQSGRPAKVMLKTGAFHMFRGHTPTHVLGLGNFVTELATADGADSFAVLAVCTSGESRDYETGEAVPCRGLSPGEAFDRFIPEDGYAVFDLEALRPHAKLWAGLDAMMKQVIWSYDAMIAVPDAEPATPVAAGVDSGG